MKNYFKKFSILFVLSLILILGSCVSAFAADTTYTDNLIPAMISDTAPSGIANASSEGTGGTYSIYKAFDRKASYWMPTSTSKPQWISYKFPTSKKICKYTIKYITWSDLTRAPRDWLFQGSNDDSNWVTLDSQSEISFSSGERKDFIFDNTNSYLNYRIYITNTNGSPSYGSSIDEIEMMESIQNNTASISLDKSSMDLTVGNSQQLTATTTPASVGVTWSSSNPAIATVDNNGNVTAIGEGQTVITATINDGSNISASCTVNVTNPVISEITLNKTSDSLTIGQTDNLVATTTPSNTVVNWSSSDSSIATVDSNGKVTGIKAGTVTITATTVDGLTATCIINVASTTGPIEPEPTEAEYIVNTARAKGENTNNASGEVSIIFKGIAEAQLSVVKTADVDSVYVGDNFTYTIVVTNTSSKIAKAVVINDSAPNHIDFIVSGVTTTQGNVDPSSTPKNIVVNVGDIAPLGTVTIKVPATVFL